MRAWISILLVVPCVQGCSLFRPDPPEYEALELESGVTVRDLVVPEKGNEVAPGDTVALHYTLRLSDRTVVESSAETGMPLRFEVGAGSVPRGLEQGVLGMRLFGRRRLSVPSVLAFGAAGRPPRVPPDADVLFEVELMEHTPAAR
jgi:FKBP-type peptidyl-prolyl cis-trans isomerase